MSILRNTCNSVVHSKSVSFHPSGEQRKLACGGRLAELIGFYCGRWPAMVTELANTHARTHTHTHTHYLTLTHIALQFRINPSGHRICTRWQGKLNIIKAVAIEIVLLIRRPDKQHPQTQITHGTRELYTIYHAVLKRSWAPAPHSSLPAKPLTMMPAKSGRWLYIQKIRGHLGEKASG